MNAKAQDERPLPAETITKDLSNVALTEPHAVPAPSLPSKDTHVPPQVAAAASSDPEVAENTKQDASLEVTYAPPRTPPSEPEVVENGNQSSAVVVAHAPPPSEQPRPDGVQQPQAEETALAGEVGTPPATPDQLSNEATPGAGEIPMNETGA